MQSQHIQRIKKKNADMGQKKQTQTNPILKRQTGRKKIFNQDNIKKFQYLFH